MAKQKRQDRGAWARMRAWMQGNQRVLWVVLLIIVCFSFGFVGPVQDFFMGQAQLRPVAEVYGEPLSEPQWRQTTDNLERVQALLFNAQRADFMTPLPGALADVLSALRPDRVETPFDFFAFQEKGKRLGLRVPDRELGDYVRELWRRNQAMIRATDVMAPRLAAVKDQRQQQQLQFEMMTEAQKQLESLRSQPFDTDSWASFIRDRLRAGMLPLEFEDLIRDAVLVAKVMRYIEGLVEVTPREVYEEFEKVQQTRKFRWAAVPVSEELKEKIAARVTQDDLELYFQSHREDLKLPDSVKARWLLLPKEHFEAEAAQKIQDSDLVRYYEENRNDFRRPVVLADEATFALRTAQEQAEFTKRLYRDLDEVKDSVREKVVEERTRSDLLDFASKLRLRLYPPQPTSSDNRRLGDTRPATFSELLTEYPFLQTGSVDFVSEDQAKEAFGGGYSSQIDQWFRGAAQQRGRPKIDVPESAVNGDLGMVFYADAKLQLAMVPTLKEVQDKVREAVIVDKAIDAAKTSLEELANAVAAGTKTLEEAVAGPLEVTVGDAKVSLEPGAIQESATFLGKSGVLMIPKAEESETVTEEPAAEAPPVEPSGEANEEAHPASAEIVDAVFSVDAKGKAAVASNVKEAAAYIVQVSDVVLPDPKGFDSRKAYLERSLLSEKRNRVFKEWRDAVRLEAQGGNPSPAVTGEPAPQEGSQAPG